MGNNADTVKMGGNPYDCGPSIIKSVNMKKDQLETKLFIKKGVSEETYMDGFEEACKNISFH